ncbi:response regulator transcription factor [Fulvivirga sp. M361]|uniref:response regulator n=1 Tax=Fulvivirga sp. M361 TaxID=2594266 RepID=UPI00117A3D94|nr:response regulator transcription factor [Fulvivirga sp. M361]TRX60034.1 response regulator transcription factor [Fulvivirga sp. M361]
MNLKPVNVFIVDDHSLIREGIKSSLENFRTVTVVGEAANGKQALAELAKQSVDIVLMDISMSVMDGIEATRKIRKLFPDLKVLALTMHDDNSHILKMMKAGALGYVLKSENSKNLVKAIETVAKGQTYFGKKVSDTMMNHLMSVKTKKSTFGFSQLTKREVEILRHIAEGLTNPEIAKKLFIGHRTVDTHRRNLIQKLNVKNTAGLVRVAIKNGVVEV